jgi:hypothetical protein
MADRVQLGAVDCTNPGLGFVATAPPPCASPSHKSGSTRIHLALKVRICGRSERILFVQHCLDVNIFQATKFLGEQE